MSVSIVIGSWGSYNECNERALGSNWLDLSEYSSWEDIEDELKNQGFELDGIDEELFIQDIEGLSDSSANWDYIHPKTLFDKLYEAEVLNCEYKLNLLKAYLEIRSLNEFFELVENHGSNWDCDIILYSGFSWEDYGREMFECFGYNIPDNLLDFFDFEAYGKYIGTNYAYEVEDGILEIID